MVLRSVSSAKILSKVYVYGPLSGTTRHQYYLPLISNLNLSYQTFERLTFLIIFPAKGVWLWSSSNLKRRLKNNSYWFDL